MKKVMSVHEAKAQFSTLLKEVETGETIVITRHERPVAELRAAMNQQRKPVLGAFAQDGLGHLEVSWTGDEISELFGL